MREGESTRARVFRFVVKYMTENGGRPPAIREIMEGVALPSTSNVRYHLVRLERDGRLRLRKGEPRGIEVVESITTFTFYGSLE